MNQIEKIDYMIKSLEIAKDEIEYAQLYNQKKIEQGDNCYYGLLHRSPNGTIMRESLRMVGKMANQIANDISLTPYCDTLFRE